MWPDPGSTKPTLALPSHFCKIFSLIFEVFRTSAATGKTLTTLQPLDHQRYGHLTPDYRPRPSTGTAAAAALGTGGSIMLVVSHSRGRCSSHFSVPSRLLRRSRPPRLLSLAEAEILRPP